MTTLCATQRSGGIACVWMHFTSTGLPDLRKTGPLSSMLQSRDSLKFDAHIKEISEEKARHWDLMA